MDYWLDTEQLAWVLVAALPLGWWVCKLTADHMQVNDPSSIVWDEIAAFWWILFLWMPASLTGQFIAFVLFRLFDAVKPGPVGWADAAFHGQGWRGGFGIMFDDIVAAFCTLICLALWQATR
jgi:phosphatidylglycerophosphatase A